MTTSGQQVQGKIATPQGWVEGALSFGDRILNIEPLPHAPAETFILPGFIDVHVHGGGGGDAMDGEAGVATLARFHARHGTTTLLPTTITSPWPQVISALRAIERVRRSGVPGGADVWGAHLEGPFINPQKLGAQPPFARLPAPEQVAEVLALDVVRVVTLAPELDLSEQAAEAFARAGVRVSFGHTLGCAEEAQRVARAVRRAGGVVGGTHLYNAMSGLSGREPGVVGALLADAGAFAEVILDGHHVHPASFLAACHAKPERLLLVTDAMRAAGQGDGVSELGGQAVTVRAGVARLAGGSLAGSVLTMDLALRNAVQAGLPLLSASRLASAHPARYLGLNDRGELRPGRRADLVVLSRTLEVEAVYVGGELTVSRTAP